MSFVIIYMCISDWVLISEAHVSLIKVIVKETIRVTVMDRVGLSRVPLCTVSRKMFKSAYVYNVYLLNCNRRGRNVPHPAKVSIKSL